MSEELTKVESSVTPLILNRNPIEVLEDAKKAAQALTTVISQKKKPVIMNGEQYLEFEDWQTVGQFYGYMVSTGEAMPVEIDGVKGAKASAKLVNFHSGEILGGAESYCMRDEPNWKTKPWFQLASMAQTRAGAKALRNRLAWVVVLAGYRPTPAEEIQDIKTEPSTDAGDHFCTEHNAAFFMRGKMKSFAHPIGDTKVWCHEHKDKPEPPMSDKEADALFDKNQPPQVIMKPADKPPVPKPAEKPAPIDNGMYGFVERVYLDESLRNPKLKKSWPATQMMTWLRNHNAGASTIQLGAAKLNEADAKTFCKEIQDRMAMA